MSDISETTEGTDEAVEAADDATETDEAVLGTAYPDEAPAEVEPEPEVADESTPEAAETPDDGPADVLARGHRGAAVTALQHALCDAGHEVRIDSNYGRATRAAVAAFQTAQGFPATGTVGRSTADALGL